MIALTVKALIPVVLLIALGRLLKRSMLTAESFWSDAERLGYRVLLPALFLHGLATANLHDLPVGPLAAVLVASTLVVAVLVLAFRSVMRLPDDGFTSARLPQHRGGKAGRLPGWRPWWTCRGLGRAPRSYLSMEATAEVVGGAWPPAPPGGRERGARDVQQPARSTCRASA